MPSATTSARNGIERDEKPKDLSVRLQYLANDPMYAVKKPLQVVPGFLDKENRSNVRLSPGPEEVVHDIRGREKEFSLDRNGFYFVKAPTRFNEWTCQQQLGDAYLQEVEQLLRKTVEDVDEVVFFDVRLRHNQSIGTRGADGLSSNPFARQVHVDQTEPTILTLVRNLTDLKADYLLKGRVRVVNIWRPIHHPVYDCALTVADGSILQPSDVVECDRIRRDTGKFHDTMGVVMHRPGYKWWYMSEQTPDDVILFKGYDSDAARGMKDVAGFCLHTAFDVPLPLPPGAKPRESIEVRALIFTYPPESILPPLRRPSFAPLEPARLTPAFAGDTTNPPMRLGIADALEWAADTAGTGRGAVRDAAAAAGQGAREVIREEGEEESEARTCARGRRCRMERLRAAAAAATERELRGVVARLEQEVVGLRREVLRERDLRVSYARYAGLEEDPAGYD